jgi:hypothetical protein
VLAPPNGKTVHAATNLSHHDIEYWFYFSRLSFAPPAAPRAGHEPDPFIAEAAARATVAGRPLSALPPGAYRW